MEVPNGPNSSINYTDQLTQAMNDMMDIMNLYGNLDYRTVGDTWKNEIRRYYSNDLTSGGVLYSRENLPKFFDFRVQQVKDGKYIQESIFVTDLSLVYRERESEWASDVQIVRGTQYVRFTSVTDLPDGVELNKWYKRDVDVRFIDNLWGDRVPWDTADHLYSGYSVITPYQEVVK